MVETYRKPNGKFTHSLEVYLREWRKLGKCVEKKIGNGAKIHGFDPDIKLAFPNRIEPYNQDLYIPLWLALAFQKEMA
jgi:hypothetical protein